MSEEYPPETLAFLPLQLRHRLLLNLPVADVSQLENTAVLAGIDMEATVWKVLYPYYHKKQLISYTCKFILRKLVPKELFFSARGCLGVSNWEGLQHSFAPIGEGDGYFKYPTPPPICEILL